MPLGLQPTSSKKSVFNARQSKRGLRAVGSRHGLNPSLGKALQARPSSQSPSMRTPVTQSPLLVPQSYILSTHPSHSR